MSTSAARVRTNLGKVREAVERACVRSGREPSEVSLVAASKGVDHERIRSAFDAGVGDFGENYVNELREKAPALPGARWHFIGVLQTNTAHHVAALADVVETLAGQRATERLSRRAEEAGRTIEALIEVDLTRARSGVVPEELSGFADVVARLPGLRPIGLMTLPPVPERPEGSRRWFAELRELRDLLRREHPGILELSMGMSLDYEVAVEEGATMVRIGTALFGPGRR